MYKWWKIANLSEFNQNDVPDLVFDLDLKDLGLTTIVVARGFMISVLFLGYWVVPKLNGRNAFNVDDKVSAYIDEQNNLWVGANESFM